MTAKKKKKHHLPLNIFISQVFCRLKGKCLSLKVVVEKKTHLKHIYSEILLLSQRHEIHAGHYNNLYGFLRKSNVTMCIIQLRILRNFLCKYCLCAVCFFRGVTQPSMRCSSSTLCHGQSMEFPTMPQAYWPSSAESKPLHQLMLALWWFTAGTQIPVCHNMLSIVFIVHRDLDLCNSLDRERL